MVNDNSPAIPPKTLALWMGFYVALQKCANATEAMLACKPNLAPRSASVLASRTLSDANFQKFRKEQDIARMSRAERWQSEQVERCERYRTDIDATRDGFPDHPDRAPGKGGKMIEPDSFVDLMKVEELTDRMARRSLGLDKEEQVVAVSINVMNALNSSREKLSDEVDDRKLPKVDKVIDMEVE